MNINFKETYKSLSTAELLNIVKQPNDYQPEAVMAANEILKGRTITHADFKEGERMIADIKGCWVDEKELLNTVSVKIENLVEPIVRPETEINTKKWINILIVTLSIYTTWMVTNLVISWRRLSELNRTEYFRPLEMIEPLYLLITMGGLYIRKKWGWMLLMIFFVLQTLAYALITCLSFRYSFFRYIAAAVLATMIYGAAVYLLSRKESRTYFNINDQFFRNTVFSAIIIFLLMQIYFKYFQVQ